MTDTAPSKKPWTRITRVTIAEKKELGYFIGMDACEYLGMPRSKESTNVLNRHRRLGLIEATEIDGNYYFTREILDAYKAGYRPPAKKELTMQPPPPSSQHHAQPATTDFALQLTPPLYHANGNGHVVEADPTPESWEPFKAEPIAKEDELDYDATYKHIQSLASTLVKKCGVTRWRGTSIDEVELETMPRVWEAQFKPFGSTRSVRVRVRLEGGSYHVESPALIDHLQAQIAMLQADLAYAQQKAAVAIKRNTTIKGELRGKDPTMIIPITYEPLNGEVRVSSADFPYDARGATNELASANYRMLLHSVLGEFHRVQEAGDQLRIDQEYYLDKLELFFDEYSAEAKTEKELVLV